MADSKHPDTLVKQPTIETRSRLGDVGVDRPAMQYDYTNFYFGAGEDPFALLDPFDAWWSEAEPAGYYQYELPLQSAPSTRVDVLDKKTGEVRAGLINFASYNYLGLSYRTEVKEAIKAAVDVYGGGASGSPILSGTTALHQELSEEVARFKLKEGALIFPTGYSANVGTIAGLMRSGDLIVADQWAHASIVDGMILSKATSRFFRHNNVEDLERKLSGFNGKKLVVVEGVYSMDGDLPPLRDIVAVSKKYGARVMIDEAHSVFVFGANGRGVVEALDLDEEVDIHLGTFSKSLGGQGGYTAGSLKLINYLRGFSRSRFFSCALAPTVTAGGAEGAKAGTSRAAAPHQIVGQRTLHEGQAGRGRSADRGKRFAGDPDHGERRRAHLPDRGRTFPRRRLHQSGQISGGAQTQKPLPHVDLRGPHPRGHRAGRCTHRRRPERFRRMPVAAGRYAFTTGVSAFFEMPTSDARRILPEHLEPVEVTHQRSILAATTFHFTESVAGPYVELMFSVIVPARPRAVEAAAAPEGRLLSVPGGHEFRRKPTPSERRLQHPAHRGGHRRPVCGERRDTPGECLVAQRSHRRSHGDATQVGIHHPPAAHVHDGRESAGSSPTFRSVAVTPCTRMSVVA